MTRNAFLSSPDLASARSLWVAGKFPQHARRILLQELEIEAELRAQAARAELRHAEAVQQAVQVARAAAAREHSALLERLEASERQRSRAAVSRSGEPM